MSDMPEAGSGVGTPPGLTARVAVSQSLFTAGNTLTVGGFFNYFVLGYHPSTLWLAVLQSAPEFFETAGLFARPLVLRVASRKSLWIAGLLLGRLAALGIPLCALLAPQGTQPLFLILGCLAVWYASQEIGYIAYLSWLSDLAPERVWGRFFASRQMAQVATSLVVYTLAALISGRMRRELSGEGLTAFFTGAFAIGGVVATASILPMLRVSSASTQSATVEIPLLRTLRLALADFNYRRLLFWSWHLAFFQGLTQAVLTKYQIEMLRIPFHWFLAMNGLMLAIQTGLSPLAGRISDRFGDVRALFLSTWIVGLALVFPMLATITTWPLMFGCYAVWGLFGVVNLCSQTLSLRIAPRSDNTAHLGLFRPISGLVAACAGLAGGAALDFLFSQPSIRNSVYASAMSYHGILGLSLVGRLTAPLWLLGIRERTRGASG